MIKLYNLKVFERSGDETFPSINLFRLAYDLEKRGVTAKEFDTISELKAGDVFTSRDAVFQVRRYR